MGVKNVVLSLRNSYIRFCVRACLGAQKRANLLLAIGGAALLYSGLSQIAWAKTGGYPEACDMIVSLIEGSFGAVVAAAAGLGAIIASAVGGFKAAWTLLVVSIGAFILRQYITLFSGNCGGSGCSEC